MNINITGHHVEITPALSEHVKQKLDKIYNHFQHITNAQVTLTVDKKYLHKAEATLHVPQTEIHAHAEAEDMYAAIDGMISKLDRQVIKHKEKMKSRDDGI